MRQTSFADMHCSLARSLEAIGDWWSPLIVRDLWLGLRRFDQLVADLEISRNLLTDRLGRLVTHGIVERVPYKQRPVRYEYTLAPAGRALVPVLQALTAWGDEWAAPPGGPPLRLRHRTCGHPCTPTVTCDQCGQTLHEEELVALPGPGGREAHGTKLIAPLLATRRQAS